MMGSTNEVQVFFLCAGNKCDRPGCIGHILKAWYHVPFSCKLYMASPPMLPITRNAARLGLASSQVLLSIPNAPSIPGFDNFLFFWFSFLVASQKPNVTSFLDS